MNRHACLVVCSALVLGCAPDPDIDTRTVSLEALPSCRISGKQVRVTALGDFSLRSETIPIDEVSALSDFPLGTREVTFSVKEGGGRVAFGAAPVEAGLQTEAAWLLPEQASCPLGDPLALALPGSAAAALPTGGFIVAGGHTSDGVVSSALVLPAGAQLAQAVPDGMLLRRDHASATRVGDLIVVAGGAADGTGMAQDTFEVYVPEDGAFARSRSQKLQAGPRMQHGAARLPDGELLLVGGRAEVGGPPLASAELIDVATGEHSSIEGGLGLSVARAEPQVLVLDDGVVLVLGGIDAAGKPVGTVEVLSKDRKRFSTVSVRRALPKRAEFQAAALPSGRVAWVACDPSTDASAVLEAPCDVGALLPVESGGFVRVDVEIDLSTQAPHGLRGLRVLALPDDHLLVTGRDPVAAISGRAFVIDLGQTTLDKRSASRVPTALLELRDGSVAELDAFGTSLRRETLTSAWSESW